MITQLGIRNFKRFPTLDIATRNLTLLTGFNAGGKSTCIQGAVLLSDSLRLSPNSKLIPLNSSRVRVGTASDVTHRAEITTTSDIKFIFTWNTQNSIAWQLTPSTSGSPFIMEIVRIESNNEGIEHSFNLTSRSVLVDLIPRSLNSSKIADLVSKIRGFSIISTARWPSGSLFPTPEFGIPTIEDVGASGEFAPWYLSTRSEDLIDPERKSDTETALTLRRQVNAWGSELFPGFQANAYAVERTGLLRLEFKTSLIDDWRSPENVGYGLGYVFPIIVGALIAQKGAVLFVDSPEAHLHPRAQSRMGYFLATMAASGVQIILETHSDHVINGVRLAVKEEAIKSSDVIIQFFDQPKASEKPKVESTQVRPDGRLTAWPEGFFDQIEHDLSRL